MTTPYFTRFPLPHALPIGEARRILKHTLDLRHRRPHVLCGGQRARFLGEGFSCCDKGHNRNAGSKVENKSPCALRSLEPVRSEENTSELQSLMRTPYHVLCWKK